MPGEAHQLRDRRTVEPGPAVDRPARAGRELIGVGARLVPGREPLRRPLPVEPDPEEVALGGVVGRCDVVEPSAGLVHAGDRHHVERPRGHEGRALAGARHPVHVAPAVPLAHPEQLGALVEPGDIVHQVHPGAVPLGEHRSDGARGGVRKQDPIGVLEAIHSLEHERGRPRPLHAGEVVLPQVVAQRDPGDGPSGRGHHARPYRRIGRAGLGILDRRDDRIERVGVVDETEGAHSAHVELPEGDPRAVGGPAEAVAEVEFLLVHPVRHAAHVQRIGASGEAGDRPIGQPLRVQIALPHVGHPIALRGELGVHQRGFRRAASAQLPERPRPGIEDPVIAPGVLTPDLLRVGEDQKPGAIGGPRVVINIERLGRALRNELAGGDHDAAEAGGGLVAHQVAGAPHGFGRLQSGVRGAALDPAHRAEPLARGELACGEDAAEEIRGVRRLGAERRRRERRKGGADRGGGEQGTAERGRAHGFQRG